MKLLLAHTALVLLALNSLPMAAAQSAVTEGRSEAAALAELTKKIDEQNLKLDALSQQILKLEQMLTSQRPGVMIGESTPAPASASAAATASATPAVSGGNSHVVAKGETLTSIAKAYKVGVQELQRFNHIENDRALQIGQTIQIPTPGASASPSPSPNP